MSGDVLLDPLFRLPFAAGLMVALVLPLLGVLLRLRDEWLAALGLAHLAGASALVGLAAGIPTVLGAPLGSVAGSIIKNVGHFRGNTVYAVMILLGWATTLLVAANTALGSVMGHALVEGQLYFSSWVHLAASLALCLVAIGSLPWTMPRLIHARLFPGHEALNAMRPWRWHLSFDVIVALGMAVGTSTLGLMGAFALVFVPPWIAFRFARNWRHCLWLSVGIGILSYLAAFASALLLDQPFGPVLVAVLLISLLPTKAVYHSRLGQAIRPQSTGSAL
ncbi:MAG: metal ABC transporter permease [Gammaproteobacteria bacterium]